MTKLKAKWTPELQHDINIAVASYAGRYRYVLQDIRDSKILFVSPDKQKVLEEEMKYLSQRVPVTIIVGKVKG